MDYHPDFHLVARPRSGWKALAELALLAVAFIGLQVLAVLALGLINPGAVEESVATGGAGAFDIFAIALSLPAAFVAARLTGRDPGALLSVERRVRWPLVGRALAVAAPVYAAVAAVDLASEEVTLTTGTLLTAAVFLAVVPLQAATEEAVFRGALPQIVGNWIQSPWLAYGAAAAPFVALHIYNWIGLLDVLVICLCLSYLTWRSGGLEQAIVVHACSNLSVFIPQALRPGVLPTTDIGWAEGLGTALLTVAVTAAVARWGGSASAQALPSGLTATRPGSR